MEGFHRKGLRECRAPGCDRVDIKGLGYCVMHYSRVARHGTTESRWPDSCLVSGCDGKAHARGYCHMHYSRWRRYGNTEPKHPRQCQAPGCERTDMVSHGYCVMHYGRWKRHGDTDERKRGGKRKDAQALEAQEAEREAA